MVHVEETEDISSCEYVKLIVIPVTWSSAFQDTSQNFQIILSILNIWWFARVNS